MITKGGFYEAQLWNRFCSGRDFLYAIGFAFGGIQAANFKQWLLLPTILLVGGSLIAAFAKR